MRRSYHPSGDLHWTRQPGVIRRPWAKLPPEQIDLLCARYDAGETQTALAQDFHIGRTTIWRYLRRKGLASN